MTDTPDTRARTCPLGEDCDLTVAWMAGQQEARDSFRQRVETLTAQLGLARVDSDQQLARAEAAEAERDRLREAAAAVLKAADSAQMRPKPGCGISGMTVEANIRGSAYPGVDAWPFEKLRAVLTAPAPRHTSR